MLSENQIDHLFKFCVQHYVRYYDVQLELVDHLANAIETKLKTDKNLDFETALNSVYKGFGENGFKRIVQEKTKSLKEEYAVMGRKYIRSFFTIPRIGITLFVIAIYIGFWYFIPTQYLTETWELSWLFVLITLFSLSFKMLIRYWNPTKKLLYLQDSATNFSAIAIISQVPNTLHVISGNTNVRYFTDHPVKYFLVTVIYLALMLFCFTLFHSYKMALQKCKTDYPRAFQP